MQQLRANKNTPQKEDNADKPGIGRLYQLLAFIFNMPCIGYWWRIFLYPLCYT